MVDHSTITIADVVDMMVVYLGVGPEASMSQYNSTGGAHAKFSGLETMYNDNLEIGDDLKLVIYRLSSTGRVH